MMTENDDQNLARFSHYLKLRGLSLTRERRRILDAIIPAASPFTVDDLFFDMRESGETASKATIYRTVQLLLDCGILRESALSGRQASYEIAELGRDHGIMICQHCDKVIEFEGPILERFLHDLALEQDFLNLDTQIKLAGICADCIRENPPSLRRQLCVPFLKYAQSREDKSQARPEPTPPEQ